jgi:hypothetical protein
MESWHSLAAQLAFDESDYDLLDLVMNVAPDLRVVAYLGKLARQHGLEYPVQTREQLAAMLGKERIEAGEFVIDADTIVSALAPQMFPLMHEGEFLSSVHLTLLRCRAETTERWQRASIEGSHGRVQDQQHGD